MKKMFVLAFMFLTGCVHSYPVLTTNDGLYVHTFKNTGMTFVCSKINEFNLGPSRADDCWCRKAPDPAVFFPNNAGGVVPFFLAEDEMCKRAK